MHLVGFIIRICQVGRSPERQILFTTYKLFQIIQNYTLENYTSRINTSAKHKTKQNTQIIK